MHDDATQARFWAKVDRRGPSECWLWKASCSTDGYGQFRAEGRCIRAHRLAYELLVGPIPLGMDLDHVEARGCTAKTCVNPAHLEPVSRRVNIMRGRGVTARNARKTHCLRGHPFDEVNTRRRRRDGARVCIECRRLERSFRS